MGAASSKRFAYDDATERPGRLIRLLKIWIFCNACVGRYVCWEVSVEGGRQWVVSESDTPSRGKLTCQLRQRRDIS
jgi:hypothetical protein